MLHDTCTERASSGCRVLQPLFICTWPAFLHTRQPHMMDTHAHTPQESAAPCWLPLSNTLLVWPDAQSVAPCCTLRLGNSSCPWLPFASACTPGRLSGPYLWALAAASPHQCPVRPQLCLSLQVVAPISPQQGGICGHQGGASRACEAEGGVRGQGRARKRGSRGCQWVRDKCHEENHAEVGALQLSPLFLLHE